MTNREYFWNRWSWPAEVRLNCVFRLLMVGLFTQMLLSWSLWWRSDGVLPYLPVFFSSESWMEDSSIILFPVFLLLVILNLFFLKPKIFLKLLLLTGLLLIFGNIHRLQVWFYFYGLMLFLFLWKQRTAAELLMFTMRGVVAGVYLWSGLHKFNVHFQTDIFPWLMEPLGLERFSWGAYSAGGLEVLIALGLLFRSTRNFSVLVCLIFHTSILGLLGPFGHHWNMVVWPWNLVMPLLVLLLFFDIKKLNSNNRGLMLRSFPAGPFVLFLVWILPGFNYFGITPEQLSFKMYAGSQPEMVLYYGEADRQLFGPHPTIHGVLPPETMPRYRVVLDDVAFAEWGTPLFTTPATARRMAQQFCQKMQRPREGGILYLVDDDFVRIPCE